MDGIIVDRIVMDGVVVITVLEGLTITLIVHIYKLLSRIG